MSLDAMLLLLQQAAADGRRSSWFQGESRGVASGHQDTLDTLGQVVMAMPIDTISVTDTGIRFAMTAIGAVYQGAFTDDGGRLAGTWSQRGRGGR